MNGALNFRKIKKIMKTYQARLAMKQDRIRRKLLDRHIDDIGLPIDCIRVRLKTNDEGDILSRIIEAADVVPIVFPPMVDIPYRRIGKDNNDGWILTSLVNIADDSESTKIFKINAPHGKYIRVDDLIIRVILDDDTEEYPSIICLQVLESLGTFGGSMMIGSSYSCNLYNENLSQDVLDVIVNMTKRRLHLQY